MNFFIKMNIKNEQRRQEKCDAGQRKSNHNRHLRRASWFGGVQSGWHLRGFFPRNMKGRRWAMSHLPMEVDKRGMRRVAGMQADCT
jgi:hypothetical protein